MFQQDPSTIFQNPYGDSVILTLKREVPKSKAWWMKRVKKEMFLRAVGSKVEYLYLLTTEKYP